MQNMFEDFKEKVGKLQNKLDSEIPLMDTALAPEVTEKLRKARIVCLRLYWHLSYNWTHAPNVLSFQKVLCNCDIFEIVKSYFRICRKYHLPTFEEPYDFLSL
jgi:hypothetical protein